MAHLIPIAPAEPREIIDQDVAERTVARPRDVDHLLEPFSLLSGRTADGFIDKGTIAEVLQREARQLLQNPILASRERGQPMVLHQRRSLLFVR